MRSKAKTTPESSKRQRVSDLLRAQVKYDDIVRIVGVSKRTIANVRKRMEDGEDLSRKPHGGQNKILTKKYLNSLKKTFKKDPFQSVRSVAKKRGVTHKTILTGLKMIDMESRVRPHRQFLSTTTQYTRVTKAKKLLSKLKKKVKGTVVIFSDKKLFTVDQAYNSRNSRAIVPKGTKPPPIGRTKHP